MRFIKMHGCGNDYLLFDGIAEPALAEPGALSAQAPAMCDRRRGVGADGVIVVAAGAGGLDARAEVINADGSPGGMCGNGLRMVAKLLIERGHASPAPGGSLAVQMGGHIIVVTPEPDDSGRVARASADMGAPVTDPASVPVNTGMVERTGEHSWRLGPREMTFVSMGNPHAVLFVNELPDPGSLARSGPELERHAAFPARMNIHWAKVLEPGIVRAVTWERGAGATLACGTGACAVCVAGVLRGLTARRVAVHMPGGVLDARWDAPTGHVWLGGPVAASFEGEWRR